MATNTPYYNLSKPAVNSPVDEDLWGGQLNDNMDIIDNALHALATAPGAAPVPTGALMDFAGAAAPTGWLLCFGQAVSRTTYSDLFSVIGTTWGVGDGSTTFNVPDFRGRIAAGKDDMGGTPANRVTVAGSGIAGNTLSAAGGSQTHTLVTAELPSHSHTFTGTALPPHSHTVTPGVNPTGGSNPGGTGINNGSGTTTSSVSAGTPSGTNSNTGNDSPHNNMPPTVIALKIIKT